MIAQLRKRTGYSEDPRMLHAAQRLEQIVRKTVHIRRSHYHVWFTLSRGLADQLAGFEVCQEPAVDDAVSLFHQVPDSCQVLRQVSEVVRNWIERLHPVAQETQLSTCLPSQRRRDRNGRMKQLQTLVDVRLKIRRIDSDVSNSFDGITVVGKRNFQLLKLDEGILA